MVALTLMVVALVLRRPDPWALLPALLGGAGAAVPLARGAADRAAGRGLLLWSWWLGTDPGWLVLYALAGCGAGCRLVATSAAPAGAVAGDRAAVRPAAGAEPAGLRRGALPAARAGRRACSRRPRGGARPPGRAGGAAKLPSRCAGAPERVTAGEIVGAAGRRWRPAAGWPALFWAWLRRSRTPSWRLPTPRGRASWCCGCWAAACWSRRRCCATWRCGGMTPAEAALYLAGRAVARDARASSAA